MAKTAPDRGVLAGAIKDRSSLLAHVKSGRRAMGPHASRVVEASCSVTDSIDFDDATRRDAPEEPRWDYFLGARARTKKNEVIVGIEVHSATGREVGVVIAKKQASAPRLLRELKPDAPSRRWVWIASGRVKFSPNSRYRRRLAEARIEFAGQHFTL